MKQRLLLMLTPCSVNEHFENNAADPFHVSSRNPLGRRTTVWNTYKLEALLSSVIKCSVLRFDHGTDSIIRIFNNCRAYYVAYL